MKQCSKRKDDILLAHEQLLWVKDLLRWEGTAANEEVKEGTKKALEVLEGTLGTAAEEAKESGYCDLCNEMRRLTSCDHCPFNDKQGNCWISNVEQSEEGWKEVRERLTGRTR